MSDAETGAGVLLGGLASAVVAGVVKLVGSRKERSADTQGAADEWQQLHGDCRREVREMHGLFISQNARITQLVERVTGLERVSQDHEQCGPRIAHLEREQSIARTMLHDLMRHTSTPPAGTYTGDDVRAAMETDPYG